jgi:hypothetical protein
MPEDRVGKAIAALLAQGAPFSSTAVADAAGVSRQAAHKALRLLQAKGLVRTDGAARAARWSGTEGGPLRLVFALATLAEDRVWSQHFEPHLAVLALGESGRASLGYAVTEMLNNAIDHSGGSELELLFEPGEKTVSFTVLDDGVGIFDRVRQGLKLRGLYEAAAELGKGKVTTDPARHTGEGVFFTSKIALRFEAESNGLCWVVDNRRRDTAILEAPPRQGTRLHVELPRRPRQSLAQLFRHYTDDLQFTRTEVVVKLFEHGTQFVSRSEGRRLMHGLERFRKVTLDFRGVRGVGQGFADEVFRVWPAQHPGVAVEPVAMARAVAFMVKRALLR